MEWLWLSGISYMKNSWNIFVSEAITVSDLNLTCWGSLGKACCKFKQMETPEVQCVTCLAIGENIHRSLSEIPNMHLLVCTEQWLRVSSDKRSSSQSIAGKAAQGLINHLLVCNTANASFLEFSATRKPPSFIPTMSHPPTAHSFRVSRIGVCIPASQLLSAWCLFLLIISAVFCMLHWKSFTNNEGDQKLHWPVPPKSSIKA